MRKQNIPAIRRWRAEGGENWNTSHEQERTSHELELKRTNH